MKRKEGHIRVRLEILAKEINRLAGNRKKGKEQERILEVCKLNNAK